MSTPIENTDWISVIVQLHWPKRPSHHRFIGTGLHYTKTRLDYLIIQNGITCTSP